MTIERHELDGLELGGRERTDEQAQRRAEDGIGDRDHAQQPDGTVDVEPEQTDADRHRQRRLHGRDRAEGEGVADQEVELAHRHREQAFEGAAAAFAQGGHAGDEEHHDEREDREQTGPETVERCAGQVLEHPPQQGDQQAGQHQQHGQGAVVAADLGEHAAGDGEGPHATASPSTIRRNAPSMSWRVAADLGRRAAGDDPSLAHQQQPARSARPRPSRGWRRGRPCRPRQDGGRAPTGRVAAPDRVRRWARRGRGRRGRRAGRPRGWRGNVGHR